MSRADFYRGILKEGVYFIQKQFDMNTLEMKLRCAIGDGFLNTGYHDSSNRRVQL
jgi:hypothetical protein